MKKQIILKTVLNLIFLSIFIYSIICIVKCFSAIDTNNTLLISEEYVETDTFKQLIRYKIKYKTYELVFFCISAFCNCLCFIVFNFKDLSFLTNSLIKTIKDHSNANKEKKKQEKIEKLQAQQARINNQINELKGGE